MALDLLNSSNFEQLALKGLMMMMIIIIIVLIILCIFNRSHPHQVGCQDHSKTLEVESVNIRLKTERRSFCFRDCQF